MSKGTELWQLTRIRLLLFWREPEAMFWVFLFPLAMALVLGLAFKNRGAPEARIAMVSGNLNVQWQTTLEGTEGLDLVIFESEEELERKLRRGAVDLRLSGEGELQLRFDPSRPEAETAVARIRQALRDAAGVDDPVAISEDHVLESGSRYIDFLIPGLLGMNLMGTGIWGTGFAIVDMRQKKLLKLFLVTPMRRSSFLFAQIASRFLFLLAEVAMITLFGVWALGVPFRGEVLSYLLLCILGGGAFAGLGLLIASRAKTIEGVSGIMNFVMMPMWLLSGIFFSYERFPEIFHPFIRALPLTALNDGLRASMLEGVGLAGLGLPMLNQLLWGAAGFFIALRIFRWR